MGEPLAQRLALGLGWEIVAGVQEVGGAYGVTVACDEGVHSIGRTQARVVHFEGFGRASASGPSSEEATSIGRTELAVHARAHAK
ncbi:MAG: hypothetical protein QOI02_1738 [Actinomycetota bacterium]|jgi:hypothetical protein|nr:hypothetical protein [Actinomycetota bacterium]